jgi:gamma-glutamylcyclotransferase (GGCT)/AIG2-like uncharacterized protein YtfP
MEEKIIVGVYDGLRKNGESHDLFMSKANYLGTFYTEPEFSLFSFSKKYPALSLGGSTSVLLEVYEVTEEILKTIDYYEGCNDIDPYMNIYNKAEIETPFGECIIYIYNRMVVNKPLIESGDWFRFKKEVRQRIEETRKIV